MGGHQVMITRTTKTTADYEIVMTNVPIDLPGVTITRTGRTDDYGLSFYLVTGPGRFKPLVKYRLIHSSTLGRLTRGGDYKRLFRNLGCDRALYIADKILGHASDQENGGKNHAI